MTFLAEAEPVGQNEQVTELQYRCPSCDASISVATSMVGDEVDCPNCSTPFLAAAPKAKPQYDHGDDVEAEYSIDKPTDDESEVAVAHPAMFRKHPLQFIGLMILLVASLYYSFMAATWAGVYISLGVVLIIAGYFGYWWLEIIATKLTVTNKRTTLRHGIIAKTTSEVQHDDIRNLQIHQNALERILGIGDIAISSSGQDDLEVYAYAIPKPNKVAELVRRMQ